MASGTITAAKALRPTASNANTVAENVASGAEYMADFVKSLDSQTVYTALGFAVATVGVGSVAYFLGGSRRPKPKRRTKVDFKDGKAATKSETDLESTCSNDFALDLKNGNVLILNQCPRGRKTPCIAPFPLKLETFLRVHKIEYELDFNGHEPKLFGSPWIRLNTEDIADTNAVIRTLIEAYDIKLEKGLTPEQRAITIAYGHLLNNHLYWGIALWRWVYDGARSVKDVQLLPMKTQLLIPDVCKTVEQAAWFHGIGKMSPDDVRKAVLADLGSLSEFLGTKKYFLNTPLPTELDCTAFGMLAQFLWNMNGPFHDAIADTYKNLREFCWRIRQTFWPDWEDCLNNTQFFTNEPYPVADSINYPF
ncbi:hypothetical protein Ocin01_12926 [Orchesella cincta]|uniref:Failed axon connections n=1 Tax=Orchesella cincta TaxID=48709 RepID=A0A1D2ML51_ORCCI|nr:hypothetical protein Ocin01_12926 [Orchesella cincta]